MPNEIQTLSFTPAPTGGTYTLQFGSDVTSPLNYNDAAETIELALQSLPSIGTGNAAVSGSADSGTVVITFIGALANTDLPQTTCDASALVCAGSIGAVSELVAGTSGSPAQSSCTFVNGPAGHSPNAGQYDGGGQFGIGYANAPTNGTPPGWNWSGNPTAGSVAGTGPIGSGQSDPGSWDAGSLQMDDPNNPGFETGWDGTMSLSFTDGSDGTAEVQSLPYPSATGGSFVLAGQTVVYAPAASDIQAALDVALGSGVVSVTQPGGPATALTITWSSWGVQSLLTEDGTNLTAGVASAASTTQQGGPDLRGGIGRTPIATAV